MLLRGNKGKGREKGKMKKIEGYVDWRMNISYFRQEEEQKKSMNSPMKNG